MDSLFSNELLLQFIILNVVNVIIQTTKSIITIKCGRWAAAFINALAFGLYTVVLVYMNCPLELWQKVIVVSSANFIGVFVVKSVEEKLKKDKLWKVEATINGEKTKELHEELKKAGIGHNYVEDVGQWSIFNCYCATQAASSKTKEILLKHKAKFFVSETKIL